jgi:hypothetical protein
MTIKKTKLEDWDDEQIKALDELLYNNKHITAGDDILTEIQIEIWDEITEREKLDEEMRALSGVDSLEEEAAEIRDKLDAFSDVRAGPEGSKTAVKA